jgi:dihydrofolate reductase
VAKVFTMLAVSVDGFIAGPDDGPQLPLGRNGAQLFDFFEGKFGDTPSEFYPRFRMSRLSAEFFDKIARRGGAVISGRRTYDITNGWGGDSPLPGTPLFVLTHSVPEHRTVGPTPQTFVLDGIESAVAQATAAANGKDVSVMGSAPVQECVRAGLLDEIHLHLIPVLLGGGVRLFDHLGTEPTQLECIGVVDAPGVTHLSYRVSHS